MYNGGQKRWSTFSERERGREVDTFGGLNHRETIRVDDKEDDAFSVRKWSSPLLTYTLNPLSITQYTPRPKSVFCVSLLETGGKTVLAETRKVKPLSLQFLLSHSLNQAGR